MYIYYLVVNVRACWVFIGSIKSLLGASFIFETEVFAIGTELLPRSQLIRSIFKKSVTLHYCHKRKPISPSG